MERVKNKVLYHFHKVGKYDDKWFPGNELSTSAPDFELNDFWSVSASFRPTSIYRGKENAVFDKLKKHILNPSNYDGNQNAQFLEVSWLLDEADIFLKEYDILLREYIYENIRLSNYSTLPSRTNSIWLCDKSSLKYWGGDVFHEEVKLYEVNVTGDLHNTDASLLPNRGSSHFDIVNTAHEYWNASNPKPETSEYLFRGELKIVKEVLLNDIID